MVLEGKKILKKKTKFYTVSLEKKKSWNIKLLLIFCLATENKNKKYNA